MTQGENASRGERVEALRWQVDGFIEQELVDFAVAVLGPCRFDHSGGGVEAADVIESEGGQQSADEAGPAAAVQYSSRLVVDVASHHGGQDREVGGARSPQILVVVAGPLVVRAIERFA